MPTVEGPDFKNLTSEANRPPLWFSLPIPFIARNTEIPGKGEKPSLPFHPHAPFPGLVSVGRWVLLFLAYQTIIGRVAKRLYDLGFGNVMHTSELQRRERRVLLQRSRQSLGSLIAGPNACTSNRMKQNWSRDNSISCCG